MVKIAGKQLTVSPPSSGETWHEVGLASLRSGNLDAARDAFERCLILAPDFAPALASLAFVLMRLGRHRRALHDISRAIALSPQHDGYLHNRAVVFTAAGRYHDAIRDYERALEINPRSSGTHNNLAWLLAAAPDAALRDGARAVAHARLALEGGVNGAWLDTLAAALAEVGDFEQAVEVEQRAYQMSQPKNPSFRQRADLYRQRVSYAQWRRQRGDQSRQT